MSRRSAAPGHALSVSARQQIDAIMDTARNQIEAVLQREVSRLVLQAQKDARQETAPRRENAQRAMIAAALGAGSPPIYVRPSRAQQMFGVHRATLYRWADAGHITIHKRGTASFVRVDEVRACIEGSQP